MAMRSNCAEPRMPMAGTNARKFMRPGALIAEKRPEFTYNRRRIIPAAKSGYRSSVLIPVADEDFPNQGKVKPMEITAARVSKGPYLGRRIRPASNQYPKKSAVAL